MKKILILIVACFSLSIHGAYAASTCPKVFWNWAFNECQAGEVNFGLTICSNDLGQPNVVFDHVDWNFGDGTPVVSNNDLSIVHNYSNGGTYFATAQVYFMINGVSCSTVAMYITSQTVPGAPYLMWNDTWSPTNVFVDQCVTPNPALLESFVTVVISILNADLWVDPAGPYTPGQAVNLNVSISNLEVGGVLFDTLRVNNLVVSTGIYANNGTYNVSYTIPPIPAGQEEGLYAVELKAVDPKRPRCPVIRTVIIEILPVSSDTCNLCFTYQPKAGKRYWISAWVKVIDSAAPQNDIPKVISYDNGSDGNTANIQLAFIGSSPLTVKFRPSGDIIEGWQRIAGEFIVPGGATELDIKLMNPTSNIAYFDDVRIHPFNASMKSYVNDPETFWLTAELDDNNYATFYEYDKEGKLIRIKKETSRGIVTIKENRSSNPKQN